MRPKLILAFLCVSALGCNQAGKRSEVHAALPVSWPLAYVVLPKDATSDYVGGEAASEDRFSSNIVDGKTIEFEGQKYSYWLVGFDTDESWKELAANYDDLLEAQGFVLTSHLDPSHRDVDNASRRYESAKLGLKVVLVYEKSPKYEDFPAYEGYTLGIYEMQK